MTAQGKPLSQRFSEAYDFGFIKLQHRSVFDALEALKPEIEHLEANRAFLLRTHSEQVDLINDLQAKLALYEKSGCDLVVCNEPQRCGTVKELEAERDTLQEEVKLLKSNLDIQNGFYNAALEKAKVVGSALGRAREEFKKVCELESECGIALLNDHDCEQCEWYPIWKALTVGCGGSESCTKADAKEKPLKGEKGKYPCPKCGSNDWEPVLWEEGEPYDKCNVCGYHFTSKDVPKAGAGGETRND